MMSLPKQNDASKTNRVESTIIAKRKASEELPKDSSIRREVKTYGKRLKPNASLPSTKRQRISQASEESKNAESQTKIKQSQHLAPSNCPSIKSYFQPIAACPNPKSRKRPRRLTTKNTQPLPSPASFEMGSCLSKIFSPKNGSTTTTSGGNSNNAARTPVAPVHSGPIKRRQMLLYTPVDVAYCCVCTMRYDRTDDNDVAEHAKFHKTHCSIEKLEKPLKTAVDVPLRTIWKHPRGADEWIISIDRYCSHSLKGFACSVLDLTLDDIGSPFAFTPESVFHNERTHKVYVYVKEGKPVAVLDAEQDVPFAGYYQVDKSTSRASSNEKALPHKVYMLVDRIWTQKEHRRKGYATKLIDAARDGDFWGKWRLDRESIAFSWPTEVGRSFAAKYQKDCFPGNGEFLVDLQFF